MAEAGRIHVELETRLGKLEANLKQAEQMVAGTSAKLEKMSAFDFLGKGFSGGIRLYGALRAVDGALKGIDIASSAIAGDWERALDVFKQLPFGIGQVTDALDILISRWIGLTAIQERASKQQDIADRYMKGRALREKVSRELELSTATELEQKRLAARFEREDIERGTKGLPGLFPEQISSLAGRLEKTKIAAAEKADRDKRIIDFDNEISKRTAAIAEHLDKQREITGRIKELDLDIVAARLQAEGKVDAAARQMIENRYIKQMNLAETAAERERILTLKNLELAQLNAPAAFAAVQVALSRSALTEGGTRAVAAARKPLEVEGFDILISLIRDVKERLKPQTTGTIALAG